MSDLKHVFNSSWTCDYCGVAEEKTQPNETCPARKKRKSDSEVPDTPPGLVQEIIDEMVEMSGLILFRVRGTWASQGRTGELDELVVAPDAIAAVKSAWETEEPHSLRTLNVEWLSPIESVKKWESR